MHVVTADSAKARPTPKSIQLCPRRLYKYGRLGARSEATFSSDQLWFSTPLQLNDPFECRPWFTFEGTDDQVIDFLATQVRRYDASATSETALARARNILRGGFQHDRPSWEALRQALLEMLSNEIGLYCLAEIPDSILMWTHYADDHKGFCLAFEATDQTPVFGEAQKVIYSDDYPQVDFFNTPHEKQVDLIFLTKFSGWAYEREWRIVDHERGPGLRTYPRELLKEVIFGLRMSSEDKARIRAWVSRRGHPVELYQAVRHEQSFSVVVQDLD